MRDPHQLGDWLIIAAFVLVAAAACIVELLT